VAHPRLLRRLVRQLRGCLPRLPKLQARVLRLRAGVGPGGPRSTATVARLVDRTVPQVRRVQRRAVRRLRAEARDGCSAVAAPDGAGATDTGTSADAGLAALGTAGGGDDGDGAAGPGGAGDAKSRTVEDKGGGSNGVLGVQDERSSPLRNLFPDPPGGADITLPVLAGLLLTAFLVAARLRRRRG
jgi:hypothetical protein